MAISERELSYGAVTIFDSKSSDTLGRGSYGKVCKAKCGQLPCAAKLPHDIILDSDDPNIRKFVEQFEQECQFLKMIKHPNIVQFLGAYKDPQSQRLALLIELMDESLTRFLEQSTGPLPYHIQLNICQDVALALAYLHSNDIVHRDLTSNNVLLIGEGSRAKVTDFGMSRLLGNNPNLTKCPGNVNYMPPEALITPPQYSSKLDCFSHGVLTIQIVTRQFPSPGDAHMYIEDPNYPDGRLFRQIKESERRKDDIDLVAPDHPLLPLALHCLKDRDTERPSADELCGRLAIMTCEAEYTHSVKQFRKGQQIKDELNGALERARRQIQEKESELERARSSHERELYQCNKDREDEMKRAREQYEKTLNAKETLLQQVITDFQAALQEKQTEIERLCTENQQKHNHIEVTSTEKPRSEDIISHHIHKEKGPTEPMKPTWRQGTRAPERMSFAWGAAVVHGNTAYFSQYRNVYSYKLLEDKWTTLPPCEYEFFGLAIVKHALTTIGGKKYFERKNATTNVLKSYTSDKKWEEVLPPMPTARQMTAAATTPTQLVVAVGVSANSVALSTVEVLNLDTLQWSTASSSPKPLKYPHMTLCGGYLYLSEDNTILSCSMEELLKSCKPPTVSTSSSDSGSVWTQLTDIPVHLWASLVALSGQILVIGGEYSGNPTGAIHYYNRSTNSWSVLGEMPTPRACPLVAVLPSKELIVVGGWKSGGLLCKTVETATMN